MSRQDCWGLAVEGAVQGFLERDFIILKFYTPPDCAFQKDDYNSMHILFMHIFLI
ncbi:hypothetical protein EV217_1020 [Phyllobacterium myrsinacearum]|jgi:hypothetical protein|nr:hypothetical protein EV217_1020 [Phyllobacterium myrsinacearum]